MGIRHQGRTDFKEWEAVFVRPCSWSCQARRWTSRFESLVCFCKLVRLTSGYYPHVASRRRFRPVAEPRRMSLIRCHLRAEAQNISCNGSLGLICSTTVQLTPQHLVKFIYFINMIQSVPWMGRHFAIFRTPC